MCEENIHGSAYMPCVICVVNDCKHKSKNVSGCAFGKPSNEMINWAFEYTNRLRNIGVPQR